MKKYDLLSLELFALVCDTRNIAQAAEQAHLVSSAISKRLVQLEATFGSPLLIRKRYGVVPTSAGETLLVHARAVMEALERMESDMGSHATGVRGHVRVLASASVMAEHLPNDAAQFLKHPANAGIQLDLEERNSHAVVRGVRDGTAALGVCWDAADLDGLEHWPYRTDHLAVVVPNTHPLARRSEVSFEETLDYDHVGTPPPSAVKVLMQRSAAIVGKELRYRVIVSSFEASLRVVEADLAISVMPLEFALSSNTQAKVVPLTNVWATRQFVVCHRHEADLAPAAKLLRAFLCQVE